MLNVWKNILRPHKKIINITTKKLSYCRVFFPTLLKTAITEKPIAALFKIVGIGNPIMAAQNQHFINHCNRRPIEMIFKNAGIGSPIAAFYNYCYRLGLSFFFSLL